MHIDLSNLWLLVAGSAFSIFGLLVVFSKAFLAFLERTWWKRSKVGEVMFPKNSAYLFNRYGTGLGSLLLGLGMLALFAENLDKSLSPIVDLVFLPVTFLSTGPVRYLFFIMLFIGVFVIIRNAKKNTERNRR
jgi:hypothetical protein